MSEVDFDTIARRMHEEGASLDSIARVLGVPKSFVAPVVNRNPKQNSGPKKQFLIKHDAYDEVDTPEKAYWLGYMTACGYTNKPNQVVVASKETGHLEGLAAILSTSTDIVESYDVDTFTGTVATYTHVRIESEQLHDRLHDLGIKDERSIYLTPPQVPGDYVRDYVRGVLDSSAGVLTKTEFHIEVASLVSVWIEKHMPLWSFIPLSNGMWRGFEGHGISRDRLLREMYENAPPGAYKETNYNIAINGE